MPSSLTPPLGEDRLLPLRIDILGKPYPGGNEESVEKGRAGGRGKGWGDGACLRICLGSSKMGCPWDRQFQLL